MLMVQLIVANKTMDLPYLVRIPDVTEAMFDELVDEDTKAELFDGVMIVHSPATLEHDDVGGFVRGLMRFYAARKKLGKVLGPDGIVHLKTCRKFCPDFFYVSKERMPRPMPKEYEGAPDLVGEVLSPSTRDYDLDDKRSAYQQAGVGEIWYLDVANAQLIVDRKTKGKYTTETVEKGKTASNVLKGFWVDVSWLWDDPLPDPLTCLEKILGRGK
jgi:Uma2 family endonuclease